MSDDERHLRNLETYPDQRIGRPLASPLPEGRADGRERVLSERQNLNDLADFVAKMPVRTSVAAYRETILDTIRSWSVSHSTVVALHAAAPVVAVPEAGEET